MLPVKRTRGGTQPGPLSRQDIVTAALPLLAEHGIDGLTMKAVADALGISSPALYHHFENRDALLDRLAERVAAEVDTTVAARMTWDDAIVAVILEMHRAFTRYPGLAARVMRDRHPSPAADRLSAAVHRHILAGGFAPSEAGDLLTALHVIFGGWLLGRRPGFPERSAHPEVLERMVRWTLAGFATDSTTASHARPSRSSPPPPARRPS